MPRESLDGACAAFASQQRSKVKELETSLADLDAHAAWSQAWVHETRHYAIRTNGDLEDAKQLGTIMEMFFSRFQELFPFAENRLGGKEKFKIFIYDGRQEYLDAEAAVFPGAANAFAFYNPNERRLCGWRFPYDSFLRSTFVHEGTHQINHISMLDQGNQFPQWFEEGLASYYETSIVKDDKLVLGELNMLRLPAIQQMAKPGASPAWISLAQVFGPQHSPAFGHVHYGESWAFLHYMLHKDKDGKANFRQYRDMALRGRFDMKQFSQIFGKTPLEFDKVICEYVLSLTPDPSKTYKGILQADCNSLRGDLDAHIRRDPVSLPYALVCDKPPATCPGHPERWQGVLGIVDRYLQLLDPKGGKVDYYQARKLFRRAKAMGRAAQLSAQPQELDLSSQRTCDHLLEGLALAQRAADILEQSHLWGNESAEDCLQAFLKAYGALRKDAESAKGAFAVPTT